MSQHLGDLQIKNKLLGGVNMLAGLINETEVQELTVSERMRVYEASFNFNVCKSPNYKYFYDIINFVPRRDKIILTIQDDNESVFDFLSKDANEETYKKFINNTLVDENINVKIRIEKGIEENRFSIYSYKEFVNDILSLTIEDVLIAFSEILKESSEYVIFDIFSSCTMFATKTMFFVQHGMCVINQEFNRIKRIDDCKEASYFYNFDKYEVIPDDFKIDIDYADNPLSGLFRKIVTLLSIGFIATSSTISNQQIRGIVNGQRAMEFCCNTKNIPENRVIYRIYSWIYTDGNAIDKAIIARNVISLHCKYAPILELDEKVMASIQSNYNLYLKDNVVQYLELKNKVAEFISETMSKTGEYATGLLDKFKANIIAIFGFIFTVILANIVSTQPLDNLFTKEITILMESVIIGSFIYLIICYLQSNYEINKVYESYVQLKKNYQGILTKDDLLEVFGDDQIVTKMKMTINKSKKRYMVLWILFLIIALITIELISSSPTFQYILDFIKCKK